MSLFSRTLLIVAIALSSCLSCGPKIQQVSDPYVGKKATPVLVQMHGDTEFTSLERMAIDNSIVVWKAQTGGLANISVTYDLDFNSNISLEQHKDDANIVRATSDLDAVKTADCEAATGMGLPCNVPGFTQGLVLAWVQPGGGIHNGLGINPSMIVVVDRLVTQDNDGKPTKMFDIKYATQIITHEMGHIFGVPHIDDPKAVMYPTAHHKTGSVCLTEKDLHGYCMANGCGNTELSPCDGEIGTIVKLWQ